MEMKMYRVEYVFKNQTFRPNVLAKNSDEAQNLIMSYHYPEPINITTVSLLADGLHRISEDIRTLLSKPAVDAIKVAYETEIASLNEKINALEEELGNFNGGETFKCDVCEFEAKSKAGLLLHQRKHKKV